MNRIGYPLIPLVTSVVATVAFSPTAHADPVSTEFVTPTGNIMCLVSSSFDGTNGAECEIRDHSYAAPPKPADCHLAWGDRISLRQGDPPVVHCHGDTIFVPGVPTLPYGQTRSAGPVSCEAQPTGVTCADAGTGHYFRVSRESLELS